MKSTHISFLDWASLDESRIIEGRDSKAYKIFKPYLERMFLTLKGQIEHFVDDPDFQFLGVDEGVLIQPELEGSCYLENVSFGEQIWESEDNATYCMHTTFYLLLQPTSEHESNLKYLSLDSQVLYCPHENAVSYYNLMAHYI